MLEEQHEFFVTPVRKYQVLAATKVKMRGGGKTVNNNNTYDISSIKRVNRKFLEVSRCRRAKRRQNNVQKECVASAKLLIRPIVVFHRCRCLRLSALHDFIYFV